MKEIKNLVEFLEKNLSKERNLIMIESFNKESRLLYNEITSNENPIDTKVSESVFNIKSNHSKFKKYKSDLKNHLLQFVLLIQPTLSGHIDLADKLVKLQMFSNLSEVLTIIGRAGFIKSDRAKYIDLGLKVNAHFALSKLCLAACVETALTRDIKGFNKYSKLFEKELKYDNLEKLSEYYYTKSLSLFAIKKKLTPLIFDNAMGIYIKELKPHLNKIPSLKFHKNYYSILMMKYEIEKLPLKVIEACDAILDYISKNSLQSEGIKHSALRHKAENLHLLGKYNEAISTLDIISKEEIIGSSGWFGTMRYKVLIYFSQKNLQEVDKLLSLIYNTKTFKNTKTFGKINLLYTMLYMQVYTKMGLTKFAFSEKYNIQKFEKDYPDFARDKVNMNIPLKILKLTEAIVDKNDAEVIDNLDALKKYSSRYITKNKSTRSNCYINMLLEVVKSNFHPVAATRNAKRYIDKLYSISLAESEEAVEVEFIPYEFQWELLIRYLEQRKISKK